MRVLATLRHDEKVRLDAEPLMMLFCDLGSAGAKRVLGLVTRELGVSLADAVQHAADREQAALARSVRTVERLADQIGMVTLASVARDVGRSVRVGDRTAIAATLSRLERTARRSLIAVHDIGDPLP
jgi:hypothetical protein